MRHYADFFTISEDYSPVMTREEINKTPDRWLDFYPHTEFEDICKTLLSVLKNGAKSMWITGNYGTGKGFGSRMIVYPNNTIAARLVNHYKLGENIIRVWECLSNDDTFLPMPDVVMKALDSRIQETDNHVLVVGIDAYLSLLDADGVTAFMSELRQRLDANNLNVSYLLSICNKPHFEPRYEESRKMISIDGDMENLEPVGIHVFPDKWIKAGSICSYRQLLAQMNQYQPSGEYMLVLPGLTGRQAGIGNSVSFVVEPRDIALQYYGLNMDFDDDTLEELLTKSAENNQSAEVYLGMLFGNGNINPRLALKRLVEVPMIICGSHIFGCCADGLLVICIYQKFYLKKFHVIICYGNMWLIVLFQLFPIQMQKSMPQSAQML